MYKLLQRISLFLLSLLPIASVSVAAEIKLVELRGQEQADLFRSAILKARHNLFPNGQMRIGREQSFERFQKLNPHLSEADQHAEFMQNLEILFENDLIEVNEKEMMASIPSNYA